MKDLIEVKESNFNKFLIVGNKYSNYKHIEKVLKDNGIEKSSKLKKEKITPKEVSRVILKNNKSNKINPIWNGLVLELFLSNKNKDYWLWSDKNAIDLLNFWKDADNNLAFILVYSTPQSFIKKLIEKFPIENNKEKIDLEISKWIKYNRKLLNFYYRNNDCSILVNSDQVSLNSIKYLESLKEQKLIRDINLKNQDKDLNTNTKNISNNKIYDYILSKFVNEYEDLISIYEEMQSCANFPFKNKEKDYSSIELLKLYNEDNKEKQLLNENLEKIKKLNTNNVKENELLLSQLFTVQEQLEEVHLNKNNIQIKLEELSKQKNITSQENTSLQKENESLLSQLFTVQKQLEELHLNKNNIQTKLEELSKQKNITSQENSSLQKENELLLNQLFTVQEELEKLYFEQQRKKTEMPKEKKLYGAAKRIENQLSYRLGSIMIKNSKSLSGLISLPFKLRKEAKLFKKEQIDRKKLPPIHKYADYYEAERLMNHLSYKLGQEIIQCFKSPLGIIKWPWAISKARKEFKKGKQNV